MAYVSVHISMIIKTRKKSNLHLKFQMFPSGRSGYHVRQQNDIIIETHTHQNSFVNNFQLNGIAIAV